MRIFWAVILFAVLLGAAYLWYGSARGAARDVTARAAAEKIRAEELARSLQAQEQAHAAAARKAAEPSPVPTPSSTEVIEKPADESDSSLTAPLKVELPGHASVPSSEKTDAPAPTPQAKSGSNTPTTPTFETIPQTIETNDDGSLVIDNKFTIKGDGSAERPYQISWELLLSAEQTYVPSEKKNKVPHGVAMLDGKHVKITGYIAFPLMVNAPRELLCMLNQWDGCCIGVPPTPYDAVEVRLKHSVTGENKYATTGTLEGVFGVKPYLVGDWLVGLYIMDNATLTVEKFGGFGD